MKKILLFLSLTLPGFAFAGGPFVGNTIIPQYIEGTTTSSNNNRVPFWFWGEIGGLTPNATYHYFVAMDTLNASSTSNGAGVPILINPSSRNIRRIANPSMTSSTGYDSLVADNMGVIHGWFGVEPTANGRFVAGRIIYPKIMLNNGGGGTTVAFRIMFFGNDVHVISFGTTSMSPSEGSAIYDSLDAPAKNFICIYDTLPAYARPVSIAIVENDSLYLNQSPSTAAFYRTQVDSMASHWGTIIPNILPDGIMELQERAFSNGMILDSTTDADGYWCYGVDTRNMGNGLNAMYLNSTFTLNDSANIPDTTWTGVSTAFVAYSNSPHSTYAWDFGDLSSDSGALVLHTYITPGIYNAQVIISTGGCADTINQTVVVLLSTGIITPMPLSFQLMPNPSDGEVYITTRDNSEKLIIVTDMLGQTIFSQTLTGNKLSIDLGGNPKGIYNVQVRDAVTGKTGVKKIVLQ